MGVDEDFPWFCSTPTETLERVLADISSKIPKIGSSYLMLYCAKLHLYFRVDIYFLQDTGN